MNCPAWEPISSVKPVIGIEANSVYPYPRSGAWIELFITHSPVRMPGTGRASSCSGEESVATGASSHPETEYVFIAGICRNDRHDHFSEPLCVLPFNRMLLRKDTDTMYKCSEVILLIRRYNNHTTTQLKAKIGSV